MNKIKIKFENCYGISQLNHEFDFNNTKAFSIYAPNGFMKTSFSKTFSDISKGKASGDLIFPERATIRSVQDESGSELNDKNIFVIDPYNEEFNSDKTSLLLVNQTIKKKYDDELQKINDKKESLIKIVKQLSGLTGRSVTPESELLKCFGGTSIFELFESIEEIVNLSSDDRLSVITYAELFNDKTIAFLESGQISTQLKDYIDKYNELVESSPVLSKTFNHYHAKTVHKNLSENGFFSASHSVNLFNGVGKDEFTSAEQFDEKIEEEKKRILSDSDLSKKFEAIDKKLTNAELRKFRDYLFDNKDVVAELSDYKKLQKNIWISYLAKNKDSFNGLLTEYRSGKLIIQEAIEAAKNERTDWEEVVGIFNKRFTVPFKMAVTNQEEVILKGSSPQISFTFSDSEKTGAVDRSSLLKVLSQGEKKALYILNILFELNARRKHEVETVLIVDDIADSFDYKNKYAIVEYLKEVSQLGEFYPIFLTHNFDFHRTISGRLDIPRPSRLFAVKNGRNLSLVQEKYQKNPFEYWKDNFNNQRFVISSIPFVRNLAEYCGWNPEFLKLTSLLHLKSDTKSITIKDLETIYRQILKDKATLALADPTKPVIDLVYETAAAILPETNATAELESKIILSIAIRLQAEEFMVKKIADQTFFTNIKTNQTMELLRRFRADFPGEAESISLLDQVNLMTPENIHLNSFMYEPILDMAPEHLKTLYTDVKQMNA